jgi:predicted N-acyltransferase
VRIEILSAASELGQCGWDDHLLHSNDFYLSSAWLGVLETISPVPPFYLIATDDHGRAMAGLAAHLLDRDTPPWDFYRIDRVLRRLAAMPDRDARGIVGVRAREPVMLMPSLLLGGRHTSHSRLLLAPGLSEAAQQEATDALLDEAGRLGRDLGARSLAFMFVDEDDRLRDDLEQRGYLAFLHAEAGVMDIDFATFDEYLGRFSRHRRRRIGKELRSFAEAGVVFSHHPLGEVIEEITPLGMALEYRYGVDGDTVAAAQKSLQIVSAAFGERAVALTAEQDGKIRGYVLAVRWNDVLVLRSAGFDYDYKGRLPLYYGVVFYNVVEYALASAVRQVLYSIESAEAKKSRGCRIIDEYGMVSGLDEQASAVLRQVLSWERSGAAQSK